MIKKIYIFFLAFSIISCKNEEISLRTNGFQLAISETGQLIQMSDDKENNFVHKDQNNVIFAIRIDGKKQLPETAVYNKEKGLLNLTFLENNTQAEILVKEKSTHLTFELVKLEPKEPVELVYWGPFQTSIAETVGETVGVVRNKEFAIGIQGLNPRTLGGDASLEDDSTPAFNIFSTTSLIDVADSLNVLYRGNTALPRDYGSSVQAYTRNRSKDRVIPVLNHDYFESPAFEDEGLIGSKIALFGCPTSEVLNTLENIEIEENLPHPMLNGVWVKKAHDATAAYLIQGFNVHNIDAAIELTKKAGLNYLYHGGPFKNWGQFDLHDDGFPENWESMKYCVAKAAEHGIKVGAHTLSNFITTNDPLVTPVPDKRLARVGSSTIVNSIDSETKNIVISDPKFFNQMKNNSLHGVMIGNELIRYESVSESEPWTLLNCERGAFNTSKNAHKAGTPIHKLIDHAYKTFLTNTELSIEVAERIAALYNETGLKQISFDGLEGNRSTGMGAYGELLFTKTWYDNLKPEIKNDYIMDASRPGHFFWHMFTRMNWGEPWYAGFRESQTNYRILNQDYFRRNYIPSMLGWFSMRATTSIEDIEWMLARSAGFDAGYCLLTSPEIIEQNGYGDAVLEKIKHWEKARMSKAFSPEQKKRMENIKAEFSLDPIDDTSWNLYSYKVQRFEHKSKIRQPGEPVWSIVNFENPYEKQGLGFILTTSENTTASSIVLEINDFKKVELDVSINHNQQLKYNGGNQIILYDVHWNPIKTIIIDADKLSINKGENNIKVDCTFSNENATLKLELKTVGAPEVVSAPN